MNVLESPLEALVFDYISFGFFTFVNNLWAWIAVITAAVSFWRIRAAGAADPVFDSAAASASPPCSDQSSNRSTPPPPPPSTSSSTPAPASSRVEDIGRTKGEKFTLYYEDDGEALLEESDAEGVLKAAEEFNGGGDWWQSWERMLGTRKGERGWYRCQDLTELNGNVVRLWDGCRRSSGSIREWERYSSKRCVAHGSCLGSQRPLFIN